MLPVSTACTSRRCRALPNESSASPSTRPAFPAGVDGDGVAVTTPNGRAPAGGVLLRISGEGWRPIGVSMCVFAAARGGGRVYSMLMQRRAASINVKCSLRRASNSLSLHRRRQPRMLYHISKQLVQFPSQRLDAVSKAAAIIRVHLPRCWDLRPDCIRSRASTAPSSGSRKHDSRKRYERSSHKPPRPLAPEPENPAATATRACTRARAPAPW